MAVLAVLRQKLAMAVEQFRPHNVARQRILERLDFDKFVRRRGANLAPYLFHALRDLRVF